MRIPRHAPSPTRKWHWAVAAAFSLLFLPLTAAAASAQSRVQVIPCKIETMIVWRQAAPIVLRVAPSIRARPSRPVRWHWTGLVADVYGTSGRWFQVRNIRTGRGRPVRVAGFEPNGGWIFGSQLAIRLKDVGGRGAPVYEEPAGRGRLIARLGRRKGRRQGVLMGCQNGWARLRIGRVIGWVPKANHCVRFRGRCR